MKYELSIKANYLPSWSLWEGVREILQNARDSEVQFGAKMSFEFVNRVRDGKKVGALIIANEGATLSKESMLLGHTTKGSDGRLIGKFGEGFKFACLALVRMGVEIKIRNGDETWQPIIERSERYNAEVLKFDISTGHKFKSRVQFEIVGVDESDWNDISKNILFLDNYPPNVKTSHGSLLTDPAYSGMVFAKGIFVKRDSALTFGYDLSDADIDRDRRMISDFSSLRGQLLSEVLDSGLFLDKIYEMLIERSAETEGVNYYYVTEKAKQLLADKFKKHNPDCFIATSEYQVDELSAFGKKATVVSHELMNIIGDKVGSARDAIFALRNSDKTVYSLSDLSVTERDSLRGIVALVGRICANLGESVVPLGDVMIVDFNDEKILGTFEPTTKIVRLARKILPERHRCLYVFIHEVAHHHGGDGVRAHEEAIGRITMEVFKGLT